MDGTGDVVEVGSAETKIGKVSHFFPKISVAVIVLEKPLRKGDTVRISGKESSGFRKSKIDFTQKVESMQLDHESIDEANPSDGEIGLKVCQEVREGCTIFKT